MDIRQQLGADRVLDPPGALPQPAERLDRRRARSRPYELEVAVERLCLDSTSHRDLRERAAGDPDRMAARIIEIVGARGKMHNPETDSGGILLGTVAAVGERFASPPASATGSSTLGSLTLTPLRLEAVTGLDPDSPQVEVAGTAYVFERAAWAPRAGRPAARDGARGLRRLRRRLADCATWCRARARCACSAPGTRASSRSPPRASGWTAGPLVAVDVDAEAIERVAELGLCDVGVDRRPARPARRARRGAGRRGAARPTSRSSSSTPTGCEPTAILLTADRGTVLFFSMATSFSRRGAGRRRDRDRARGCWSAAATRPTAAPTRSISSAAPSRCAAPSALGRGGAASAERAATGCRCAGATSTGSATSTTRSSSPTSRRGATRS